MRLAIAENMVRAVSEAPHVTAVFEADFSAVAAHKAEMAARGSKLSYTAYIVKAAAEAMAVAPAINGRWEKDRIAVPSVKISMQAILSLFLACAIVYLAVAPKSNAVYAAYNEARAAVERTGSLEVPLHLRNAPTQLMKELDYGKDYRYAHDEEGRVSDMDCLPQSLLGRRYYEPTDEGREKALRARMEEIRRIKHQRKTK